MLQTLTKPVEHCVSQREGDGDSDNQRPERVQAEDGHTGKNNHAEGKRNGAVSVEKLHTGEYPNSNVSIINSLLTVRAGP